MSYEENKEEYNDIVRNVNETLADYRKKLRKKAEDYYEKRNPVTKNVNRREIQGCGQVENPLSPQTEDERKTAQTETEKINEEVTNNPLIFGDLRNFTEDAGVGTGAGTRQGTIVLADMSIPDWVKEIKTELKTHAKRNRTKSWYDYESLVRGVPRKKRDKKLLPNETVFIIMDTSASMMSYEYKGKSLQEALADYVPSIAKKYEGEFIMVDYNEQDTIPLKDLRGATIMDISGGGGTNMQGGFDYVMKKKKDLEEKGIKVDFQTILFSDMELPSSNFKLENIPENTMFVAPYDFIQKAYQSGDMSQLPNKEKNIKVISID